MADEDSQVVVPVVPVVEISERQDRRRSRTAWGSGDEYEDDWSDEENENEQTEDDDDELHSPRRHSPSPPTQRPQPRYKSVNGKHKIDMTPPDQKLKESEKAAAHLAADGKNDAAITELTRCLAYSRIVYGASHWRHAQAIAQLAQGYLDLKAYAVQAEYHTDAARSILLHGGHTAGSTEDKAELYAVLIQVYRVMGQAQTILKKYPEAEQALLKADKISSERSKLSCVTDKECDRLDILLFNAMAKLYAKQKKFALASAKFDKAIELMEKEHGIDSPEVMRAYLDYGKMESAKGRHANHDKVIKLFYEAHSIASALYKDGHADQVEATLALAEAYSNTGWEDGEGKAVKHLEELLATLVISKGPAHSRTLAVQDALAKQLLRQGRTNEALDILGSSLATKAEVHGDLSEPTADHHKLLASIHLAEGDLEKSLKHYKKCHTIQAAILGKSHRRTQDTLKTMELIMASPGMSQKCLNEEDRLKQRPRFNSVVARQK